MALDSFVPLKGWSIVTAIALNRPHALTLLTTFSVIDLSFKKLSCMKRRVSSGTDAATSSRSVFANILKIITVPALAAAIEKYEERNLDCFVWS